MEPFDFTPSLVLAGCFASAGIGSFITWLRMRGRIKAAEQDGMRQMRSLIRTESIIDRRDSMRLSR